MSIPFWWLASVSVCRAAMAWTGPVLRRAALKQITCLTLEITCLLSRRHPCRACRINASSMCRIRNPAVCVTSLGGVWLCLAWGEMRKDLIHCVSGFSMSCLCCVFTNVDLQVNGSGVRTEFPGSGTPASMSLVFSFGLKSPLEPGVERGW